MPTELRDAVRSLSRSPGFAFAAIAAPALLAADLPARRAARIDPSRALRQE